MKKFFNKSFSNSTFRKIAVLFVSAITLLTSLSACDQDNGVSSAAAKISEDEAKQIALKDCGLQESQIRSKKTTLDTEDGVLVYEIDFYSESHEYEYDIDANTGKILKKSKEVYHSPNPNQTQANTNSSEAANEPPVPLPPEISLDKAKEIALADAGVSESDAIFTEQKQDHDDGKTVYEIDFYTDTKEYEYEISIYGEIIKKEVTEHYTEHTTQPPVQNPQDITLEQAKQIALTDAGVSESKAVFTEQKKDYHNGKTVYEIEFYTDTKEYEYEIDLQGSIVKREVTDHHTEHKTESSVQSPQTITLEEAKKIALTDAGVSESSVVFTEQKQDHDHGAAVYEIEFYTDTKEYEYEIDSQGKILKKEVTNRTAAPSSQFITAEEALTKALAHAGLAASEVTGIKTELDEDNGRYVYEVEFHKGKTEYDYEIDAVTGSIIEYDIDTDD